MATFSKQSYSTADYATHRPNYPPSLYHTILSYHSGPKSTLLDLGTGHGLVSRSLSPSFTSTIATDPSIRMIETAQSLTPTASYPNITYREATAESLPFLSPSSVDMVVAGQAAHWFDYPRFWPEMSRVVRSGGTTALWGYTDPVLIEYPKATEVLWKYAQGTNPELLGGYWSQPGRSIVDRYYEDIVPPEEQWEEVKRVLYKPKHGGRETEGEKVIEKRMKVKDLKDYIGTWSAYHGWREKHQHGERDVLDVMFEEMREKEASWRSSGVGFWEVEVVVHWGTALLLAKKR